MTDLLPTLALGLASALASPPDSAKTKLWWFHGEEPSTRSGMTADLEAFRRAGVGGVVWYDQVHSASPTGCAACSPQWWADLVYAAGEARRLGLTFELHLSDGYLCGGPWITPSMAMQRLVAETDTIITATQGRPVSLTLPRAAGDTPVAVMAWPARKPQPHTVRAVTYTARTQGKATTSATNVPGPPAPAFVGTGYRTLPDIARLEASDDSLHWRTVRSLPAIYRAHSNWKTKTVAFPAVSARWFRVAPTADGGGALLSYKLHTGARTDQWEEKAALYSEYTAPDSTPRYSAEECLDTASVVDLTALAAASGRLQWAAPPGRWHILSLVSRPTGAKTKHGRPGLTGLEADRLSQAAAELQYRSYFRRVADTLALHGLRPDGLAMDSHEGGSQNWTPLMPDEFRRLRGYDIRPWLPAMAGRVVCSPEATDRFLADLRRTVADLAALRCYATLDSLARADGYHFTAQATGNALCLCADQIMAKGRVEKPQGEFWAMHSEGSYDVKEVASAARLYGRTIASAEAFTDTDDTYSVGYLRQLADGAYAMGANEFVVCASPHQPWTEGCGPVRVITAGQRRYAFHRLSSLWPQLPPFFAYQARCATLLRQGAAVADQLVYLGDDAPSKLLTYRLPELPAGFDFDVCSTDALANCLSTAGDGSLKARSGTRYRLLILPREGRLTPRAARIVSRLQESGVAVIRPKTPFPLAGPTGGYPLLAPAEALDSLGLLPDVALEGGGPQTATLRFTHRRTATADIYFVNNHSPQPLVATLLLRSPSAAEATVYDAWANTETRVAAASRADGRTAVPISIAPQESLFVILQTPKR